MSCREVGETIMKGFFKGAFIAGNVLIISLILAFLVASFLGCASNAPLRPEGSSQIEPAGTPEPNYYLQPGDEMDIKFFYNPDLNETVTVRPDGRISLQLVEEIEAAGLTPAELDKIITERYSKELDNPEVAVIVRSFTGQKVYVGGEVNSPRTLPLTGNLTVMQAIVDAGGLTRMAKNKDIIVIRRGSDYKPLPRKINLEALLEGNEKDIRLQPYDIVYVPKSKIDNINEWINKYIRLMIPIPFSAGYWMGGY
jgi:polysaccharide export outer membrane protein